MPEIKNNHEVKPCRRCGAPILFVQARSGRWYTADVYIYDGYAVTRRNKLGFVPYHKCGSKTEQGKLEESLMANNNNC